MEKIYIISHYGSKVNVEKTEAMDGPCSYISQMEALNFHF